jgi:CRP/FNR family transcriptional regulator, cyclic AMP receptor protein
MNQFEEEFMSTLNPPEMTLDAIRSVPLFASLKDEAVRELQTLLQIRNVASGTTLFRAGDKGDALYLIQGGRVRIAVTDQDRREVVLAELAQGDFFGEMAIIDGKQRSADATVFEDAHLSVLSREDFLRFINHNPAVALELLSATFERLRQTDRMLQQRVSRNVNEEQAKRMTVADRAADLLAEFGGSWKFIIVALVLIAFWIGLNSYILIRGFDPLPYQMLNLSLAVIAGLQAPIIMMSQNRQGSKDRLRADLDYQVNLKNEIALNELLRRLDVLESERLPNLFAQQNERLLKLKTPSAANQHTPN